MLINQSKNNKHVFVHLHLDDATLRYGRLNQCVVAQYGHSIFLAEFQFSADVLLERQMPDLVLDHQYSVDPL